MGKILNFPTPPHTFICDVCGIEAEMVNPIINDESTCLICLSWAAGICLPKETFISIVQRAVAEATPDL